MDVYKCTLVMLHCHCYQLWREEGWSEKNSQREVNQKLRKGEQSSCKDDRLSELHTHSYKVSSRYSILLPNNGTHIDSVKKTNQREVTQKLRKREHSFCMRHTVLTSYTLL